jgi:hypothetical protein
VVIDKIILNNNAHQNPSTENPSTNFDAIIMINALITNKKSPNVKKVMGMVRMISTGLSNEFRIAITSATNTAVIYPSTLTPGNKYAEINTANDDTRTLSKKFIKKT